MPDGLTRRINKSGDWQIEMIDENGNKRVVFNYKRESVYMSLSVQGIVWNTAMTKLSRKQKFKCAFGIIN